MDLALALGFRTVAEMGEAMTGEEFAAWEDYARRRLLPSQRIELQLANIARLSAATADDLARFIFDPSLRARFTPKPTQVTTAEQGAQAIGFIAGGAKIVKLGVKRRKRDGE